jgi:hypothetical protein
LFVVGEVFGEVLSVFRAEELVEDVDEGGAEGVLLSLPQFSSKVQAEQPLGWSQLQSQMLVAGAFGEGFEIFADGAGEAE